MDLNNLLFGKPLRSSDEAGEKLGPVEGLSVFGLDALSSAAYGPEAALTLLIVLGAAGISYIVPITVSIIILLIIVYFSYRQTIQAYPNGGGSYTVARENSGRISRTARRRCPHDRLRSDRRGGNLSRRGRSGLGGAFAAVTYA